MNTVVFGGRSEIAVAISQKLTMSNSHVFHVSRSDNDPDNFEFNKSGISCLKMDLADEKESLRIWRDLITGIGIDSVVFAQRYRGEQENFSKMYQCDVLTPYKLVEELCKIDKSIEKRVILFTSPAVKQVLESQNFYYHATKSALSVMNKYFASGLLGNLISNAICPSSYVYKKRSEDFYEKNLNYFKKVSDIIPSGRYTQVDDIAIMTEFLLIHAPCTINGLEITIDGGLSIIDPSQIINTLNPIHKKP